MTTIDRREFILSLTAGLAAMQLDPCLRGLAAVSKINTCLGPVSPDDLGVTLIHEHVMVDFIGAGQVRRDRYDADEVFWVVLPYLKKVYELGCRTLVECTPAYLGRDPALLRRLSEASKLRLITNTGYYGAVGGKYVPEHARSETAQQLARRWTSEHKDGIEGTGVKPGFIKIGVNKGPLSEIDAKLVRAAALTHKLTGLTIASHTGDGVAALEQLRILQEERIAPSAFIWVHAQNEAQADVQTQAASQGAWIEIDGISESNLSRQVERIGTLIGRGQIDHTLISLDAGWYRVGEAGGGKFRSFEFFFADLIPALRKSGVTEAQIRKLLVENPKRALNPRLRLV